VRTVRRAADEVVVTGLGLVTPAGVGVAENWARIRSGVSTAATDPALAGAAVDFSCRVPGFDAAALLGRKTALRADRFVQLALVAAREAIACAGLDPATWDGARVGIVLGNSLGGSVTFERQHRELLDHGVDDVSPLLVPMSMVNMAAGYLSIDCGARGPSLVTATACASGTTAIGIGRDLLRAGTCDVVVAGGTESALSPAVLAGLSRMGALSARAGDPATASRPFDAARDGFVAAEGAGILVLERRADAVARSAPMHAVLLGFGASADAHHITAPEPNGAGMELALRMALADGDLAAADVDHVNAHGTSTPLNDATEAAVLARVLGDRPAVTSAKGVTGHTLAAAGAIEAIYTALALRDQVVPPTANLTDLDPRVSVDVVAGAERPTPMRVAVNTSLGFGGFNAALAMAAA
jgi:3-oxoacyl-[acyl-carrier-protein] synthase II